jgi:tape measure domain-containing protein
VAESTEHLRIVISAQDQASSVMRNLGGEMANLSKTLVSGAAAGVGFAAFNQAAQAIGQAFGFASDAVIGFNASLEQSKVAWGTLLGGAAQANTMLQQLQQFAATTPFEFPEVEASAKRLVAMGFAARDVIPLLTSVGDTASALGAGTEGVNRITLALGQMSTRTKVTAQDMLQLTEVGVPAWRILAEATGQSIAQIQDAAEKGTISSQTFIQAFQRFASANYGGLMQQQSQTFTGAVSNIRDQVRIVTSSAFEPLFNALRDLAVQFANFTQSQGFRDFGTSVRNAQIGVGVFLDTVAHSGPILTIFEGALAGVAVVLGVQLVGGATQATVALGRLILALAIANAPLVALAVAAAAAGVVIVANWDQIAAATEGLRNAIVGTLGDLAAWIGQTLVPAIVEEWTAGWSSFANVSLEALNAIGQAWDTFWNIENTSGQKVFDVLQEQANAGWGGFVDAATSALTGVLQLWNVFVQQITQIRDVLGPVGEGLLGPLSGLAGKFADVDAITRGFSQTLRAVPIGEAGNAFSAFGTFLHDELPASIGRAVELVQAAGGTLADLPAAITDEIRKRAGDVSGAMGDLGKTAGTAFGNGVVGTVKPLLEELARMLAQARAAPVQAALEDTEAAIERDKLLLQIRGIPAEARTQARREIRDLTRNVLPTQRLEGFDVGRDVTRAQRLESAANLRNQILQTQLALAGGPPGAPGAQTATGVGGAPAAVAPQAAPPAIQIPLQVNIIENGTVVQTYEELLEANTQAQLPPVVQVSAVRRN